MKRKPTQTGYYWGWMPDFGWSLYEVWRNDDCLMIRGVDSLHGLPLPDYNEVTQWRRVTQPDNIGRVCQ